MGATDAGNSIPSKDIQKQGGHWRSVMVLIKSKGINLNIQNKQGMTPLLWATGYGLSGICVALIKAGADIQKADNNGQTALSVLDTAVPRLQEAKKVQLIGEEEWNETHDILLE